MSKYHPNSDMVTVPTDAYFNHVTPTNNDLVGNSIVCLNPISADVNGNILTFNYTEPPLYYIDLSRTILKVECQIVDEKNKVIPANREVYTAPCILTSLFSSHNVQLNNESFKSGEHLGYMGYIRDLFTLRVPYKSTVAVGTNFYYDYVYNQLDLKKAFAASSNKNFYAIGNLDIHPFNIRKVLPTSMPVRFDFFRASNEFVIVDNQIQRLDNGDIDNTIDNVPPIKAKIVILNAQLELVCLELNPTLNTQIEKRLQTSNLVYEMDRSIINAHVINLGMQSVKTPPMTTGILPTRVFIFLTDQDRYIGKYSESPYGFAHHSVRRIALQLDGHRFNDYQYEVNFDREGGLNSSAIYIYCQLHRILGQSFKESCGISLNQFRNSTCCYPFDLTPGLNAWDETTTHLLKSGDLSVKIDFESPITGQNKVLIFYAEYKNTFEVDSNRHVFVNY